MEFNLNLTLFKKINISESYWKMDSVGKLFINLTKSDESIWKRLKQKEGKDIVWWELKSIYKEDMEKYEKMLEKEEDK